ncbi:MAG: isocitrate lyase/PEP mutase family protein, partial [Parcubacteria group bacterium]|nr:isocitrate lyase/PEP mutase family protein [Parcubacteria group bacterium]
MGKRFRELIKRPEGLFGFGVATALDGAEAERQGAECIYAGGYSIAMAKMLPDMGMMNMVEVKAEVEAIARSVAVPVIADIDDGYGNALNVLRTVSEFLGREFLDFRSWKTHRLAGIHLEDQRHPKRCGHIAGKEIVSAVEAADKISAASHVRNILCPSAVVISRTDAYHSGLANSLDEAVRRSKIYADAGADLVWCEFNQPSREAAERFAEGVRKKSHADLPLAFNYSPSLPWYKEKNPMTFEELNRMGYKFIFVTIAAGHAGSMAVS